MTAREHAEEAARAASDADLRASRLKDSGITFAMQAAQAHALTAIALALTDEKGPKIIEAFGMAFEA